MVRLLYSIPFNSSLKSIAADSRAVILHSKMLELLADMLKGDEKWKRKEAACALAEFTKHGKLPLDLILLAGIECYRRLSSCDSTV